MIFAFGRIRVHCIGSEELIGFFRNDWQKYQQEDNGTDMEAVMYFANLVPVCDEPDHDGWHYLTAHGQPLSMYAEEGKPLFALQYLPNQNSVKVFISKESKRSARLGAQYGLLTLLYQQCIGLHGVTLLCGDEIIILSAPSGTGKTTLAQLLEKHCDAIVINGDFALLIPTKEGLIFEPAPFCGSSGRSLNHRFRINRLVFLEQAMENKWRNLDGREAMNRFLSNAFVPTWDAEMQTVVQQNILKGLTSVKVNNFAFAPTQEAAEMFINEIQK